MVLLRGGAHVVFIAVCLWIGYTHGMVLRTHPQDWLPLALYLGIASVLIGCYAAFAEGEFLIAMLLAHAVTLFTGYLFGMGSITWHALVFVVEYVAGFTIGLLLIGVRRP